MYVYISHSFKRKRYPKYIGCNSVIYCFTLAIFCYRPRISNHPNLIIPNKEWYRFNEVLNFSCTEGFAVDGDREKRCQDTGDFQKNIPSCKGMMKVTMLRKKTL